MISWHWNNQQSEQPMVQRCTDVIAMKNWVSYIKPRYEDWLDRLEDDDD